MIDTEQTKINKAKQLRYKRPIVKNLNLVEEQHEKKMS